MFSFKKKVLFGLSVSLVLAMAMGSFALGEAQTPTSPQATAQNEAASATYDSFEVSGDTSTISFSNSVLTISGGEHTISMVQGVESTSDRINVTGSATITLEGVNISTGSGSAMTIDDSANVTVLLADGSTTILTTTSYGCAGLYKGNGGNKLTIGVPENSKGTGELQVTGGDGGAGIGGGDYENGSNITISGGVVTATGGDHGAGIGGGDSGNGSAITISGGEVKAYGGNRAAGIGGGSVAYGNNITITGGVVKAYGGKDDNFGRAPAGIGGGAYGSATGNSISGNAVVMATSGLEGVEALPNCTIDNGIVFRGVGTNFDSTTGNATDFTWNGSEMNGNVSLTQDVEIPSGLTIPDGQILSIDQDPLDTKGEKTVTLSGKDGAELTIEGELRNNWKVNLPSNLAFDGEGKVTTKTDFYREGETTVYKTGYQTYQTSAGVQKYKDLPNPDDTTLLKNSLNTDRFAYWYYLNEEKKEVAIKDGDDGSDVLPNQHKFYEKREEAYTVAISKQGEGTITPNVSEAYKDDEVTFTVTPAEGYELQENSLKVMAGTTAVAFTEKDGKYTFTMPDSAVTISAVFEQSPEPTPTPPGPEPQPTPPGPQPGPEPTPTPEPTPDPSVDPDGDGSGSGASSKTSDPFMGGMALALLGVATTGAILTRKFK